jgi:hypothetical protein
MSEGSLLLDSRNSSIKLFFVGELAASPATTYPPRDII